jgi:esterase/lipase superfamily enzyme
MNRGYHKWYSPSLNRDMELLVFGHGGARVLVFPTRQGRFYDYEDWGLVGALRPSVERGTIQLFCVDSVDSESLYCKGIHPRARITRHQQYERYILHEVVPLMRTSEPHPFLIAHGCSIGAYHAMTLALRHPGLFGKVVALSGRYDLTKPIGPFGDLFDGYYDQDIYFHTPTHFIPQLNDPAQLNKMRNTEIILAIGETDPFRGSTELLSTYLHGKGIGHRLDVWPGEAHKAYYWRQMVRAYL